MGLGDLGKTTATHHPRTAQLVQVCLRGAPASASACAQHTPKLQGDFTLSDWGSLRAPALRQRQEPSGEAPGGGRSRLSNLKPGSGAIPPGVQVPARLPSR